MTSKKENKENKTQKTVKKAELSKKKQQEIKKFKIPKTVQDTIPYYAVYPGDGVIEFEKGVFTKSYLLTDINYQIAKQEEQEEMFQKYGAFLNSFDSSIKVQITINNKNVNQAEFEKNTLLKLKGDTYDELRKEYNVMLKKKMSEGKNNQVREKYLTISIQAESYDAALTQFTRLDGEVETNIKRIGGSSAVPMSIEERLEVLHDIYNIGSEGMFGAKTIINDKEVKRFSFSNMAKMGLTSKDCIGPMSFEFKTDYMMLGDKFARALFLSDLPSQLTDNVVAELTNMDFNMVTSINLESMQQDKGIKLIRNQLVNINANMIERQKRASKSGYSVDLISPELKNAQDEANELLEDVRTKNQKIFLMTFVLVHFADSLDDLDRDTESIETVARKFLCQVKKLNWQQEEGLDSALPLANNKLFVKRTLTTESTAVFMPFVSQELQIRNGSYYGLNAVSRNMILFDRRQTKNSNGFILGTPGSGKSFAAKREMLNVLLNTDDDVVVIDPEREYGPMARMLGGEVIKIATGSKYHLNPLDMDANYADEQDPISLKSEFLLSVCEVVLGGRYGLTPVQRSIIDRCCRAVYADYLKTFDAETGKYDETKVPTLLDFQKLLSSQDDREAKEVALALELYTKGSQNFFAKRTNVETSSRFVVYDIKDIGKTMQTMGMLVVLDSIWNRIIVNRKKGRRTWFYIDEIYLLFSNESSAQFLKELYKRARKWGGVPTGITQNVEDLLVNETARTMISNCEFIMMLNQAPLDRGELAHMLNISETQLSYITNSNAGEGLIYTGSSIIPFIDKFPQSGKLYAAMTSKVDEMAKDDR